MSEFDTAAEELTFSKPEIDDVVTAIRSIEVADEQVVSTDVIYGLSDLSLAELRAIESAWRDLSAISKHRILQALNEASETMFELNYREIARHTLLDVSGLVRAVGVELLWTDETQDTMRQLIRLAENDPDTTVRVSATKGLGQFILLGEYGDMPADLTKQAQSLVLRMHTDTSESLELRRRALEALANSSHPQVEEFIRSAYQNGNHDLKISAIFAMGRTCNKKWGDVLLEELESSDSECVYEAINACGQIQLQDSLQAIGELSLSEDREIQVMAIWALGEIGGKRAIDILTSLDETADDDEISEVVSEALDSASFSLSLASVDLEFDDL